MTLERSVSVRPKPSVGDVGDIIVAPCAQFAARPCASLARAMWLSAVVTQSFH